MPKDEDPNSAYHQTTPVKAANIDVEFPDLEGKTLVTLGDPYTKMTVSMVTAFRRFPHSKILGAQTYEEGAAMVLDPNQEGDALLICCLYPKTSAIWRDMKMLELFNDLAPPFVYGQFGEGTPYLTAVHPAAERFSAACPQATSFEYVDSNERAPGTAKQLHEEFGRPIGFITAEFAAQHLAPDNIVKYVSQADRLPFTVVVPR